MIFLWLSPPIYYMPQRLSPQEYRQHFQEGIQYMQAGRYQDAHSSFCLALTANPISYSSYINLATISFSTRRFESCKGYCDLAIQSRPYQSEAYYNRCLLSLVPQGGLSLFEGYQDINAALSCLRLRLFINSGDQAQLQESVKCSHDNIESLRYLVLLGNRKYQALLAQQSQFCRYEGPSSGLASSQGGIFRLRGQSFECASGKISKSDVEAKIRQYLNLIQTEATQRASLELFPHQKRQFSLERVFEVEYHAQTLQDQFTKQEESNHVSIEPETLTPLSDISVYRTVNNYLQVPRNKKHQLSMNSSFQSFRDFSRCSETTRGKSSFCHHIGCEKCNSRVREEGGQVGRIKLQIKTVQIFRTENIAHPRPFLIIKEGTKEHITEVDFTGGYFPKWSHPIYLDAQSPADSENQNWFRIEIWNKERGDRLLGEGGFCVQGGRQQVWVTKGGKKSGYAFVRTEVTRK